MWYLNRQIHLNKHDPLSTNLILIYTLRITSLNVKFKLSKSYNLDIYCIMLIKYLSCVFMMTLAVCLYLQQYHLSVFLQVISFIPNIHLIQDFPNILRKWIGRNVSDSIVINRERTKNYILFSENELKQYTGEENGKGLYLAILGKVYDVEKGQKHYGPGGSYHFFSGRDGSRAFITGEFNDEGLVDDVLGLTPQDLKSLDDWAKFYQKDYDYKGKLIGRYYDSEGEPTEYNRQVQQLIRDARKAKEDLDNLKLKFPPCNVEWSQESGSRVWCTKMSGGIEREWTGVPRQFYEPGSESYRCACIEGDTTDPTMKRNIKEYPDCNSKASSCRVRV